MELTTTGTKNLRADIRKVPQVERLRWIANFFKLCGPIYLLLKGFSQQETLNLYLSLYLFADEIQGPQQPTCILLLHSASIKCISRQMTISNALPVIMNL